MQGLNQVTGVLLGLKFVNEVLHKASQDWQETTLLLIVMEQPAAGSSQCVQWVTSKGRGDVERNEHFQHLRCSRSAALLSASVPVL